MIALVATPDLVRCVCRIAGYYYDRETKLYYLKARYYNPEWRRFISPDSTEYIDAENPNGLNLYAYCYNDPVNYKDPSGQIAIASLLIAAFITGAVSAAANAVGQVVFGDATWDTIDWRKVTIAGIAGFASGLIPGSGFATITAQAAISSFVENGLNALCLDEEFDFRKFATDTLSSIIIGLAVNGVTHLTSKLTSKVFDKAPNFSQYQHYYRSNGNNYSRQAIYNIMKQHRIYKSATNAFIEYSLEFLSSFLAYSA
jgi:RHS repeat-associated protein